MKKIMDNKKTLVQDMLEGYVKAFPRRVRLLGNHILLRAKEKDLSKTAVIIGNGSGHEPAMIDLATGLMVPSSLNSIRSMQTSR